jgi:hypothetical protein
MSDVLINFPKNLETCSYFFLKTKYQHLKTMSLSSVSLFSTDTLSVAKAVQKGFSSLGCNDVHIYSQVLQKGNQLEKYSNPDDETVKSTDRCFHLLTENIFDFVKDSFGIADAKEDKFTCEVITNDCLCRPYFDIEFEGIVHDKAEFIRKLKASINFLFAEMFSNDFNEYPLEFIVYENCKVENIKRDSDRDKKWHEHIKIISTRLKNVEEISDCREEEETEECDNVFKIEKSNDDDVKCEHNYEHDYNSFVGTRTKKDLTDKDKISYHIVVSNYIFDLETRQNIPWYIEKLRKDNKELYLIDDRTFHNNQCFRMCGSIKKGRRKTCVEGTDKFVVPFLRERNTLKILNLVNNLIQPIPCINTNVIMCNSVKKNKFENYGFNYKICMSLRQKYGNVPLTVCKTKEGGITLLSNLIADRIYKYRRIFDLGNPKKVFETLLCVKFDQDFVFVDYFKKRPLVKILKHDEDNSSFLSKYEIKYLAPTVSNSTSNKDGTSDKDDTSDNSYTKYENKCIFQPKNVLSYILCCLSLLWPKLEPYWNLLEDNLKALRKEKPDLAENKILDLLITKVKNIALNLRLDTHSESDLIDSEIGTLTFRNLFNLQDSDFLGPSKRQVK